MNQQKTDEDLAAALESLILEEAKSFPLGRFIKSDGSINRRKLTLLSPHHIEEALKYIFIRKSIVVHGEFFGYRKTVYKDNNSLVTLYCPDHKGFFQQNARSHLQGYGCAQCSRTIIDRETEVGVFTVPTPFHQYRLEGDEIVFFTNKKEKRIKYK